MEVFCLAPEAQSVWSTVLPSASGNFSFCFSVGIGDPYRPD